jgi:hypothetical protein
MRGNEGNIDIIRMYGEVGLLSPYRLNNLLDMATARKDTELSAYLIDLIKRKYGSKAKSLKL